MRRNSGDPTLSLHRSNLAETTLGVLAVGTLIGASLWILSPFIGPGIWAAMVVIASWPMMRMLQARFGGRRWIAVFVMTLLLVLLFLVPLTVAIATIVGNADQIGDFARGVAAYRLEGPPAWLVGLPYVGTWLGNLWDQVVAAGAGGLLQRLAPYGGVVTRWIVGEVSNVGVLLLQFLMTVGLAAVMYASGETWATTLLNFGRKLGGERGEQAVRLAADATRGVALGVGVTALVQSLLGGITLALAGVPFAGLLTAVMFMLCLAQLGPTLVLAPATLWLFWQGDTGWGIFALVLTIVVGTIDNFIRPVLIRLGADLPLLLILIGVIGGLFAFGLVGIFVGPVVLAVGWTLLDAWVAEEAGLAPPDAPAHDDARPRR